MSFKTFVITLNPGSQNVLSLLDEVRQNGIEIDVFDAIDGREGMPVLDDEVLDQERALLRNRAPLSSSEVGCYLSHYRLIKRAYESGVGHLCILEDDIGLETGLGKLVCEITKLPETFELVRLMGLRNRRRKLIAPLSDGRSLVRPFRGVQGTQGYVLNRKGMEKVIRHGRVISLPIDIFYDTFWESDLRCFCVEPHALYEITQTSSVKKSKEMGRINSWPVVLRWRLFKGYKSICRMNYILRNCADFFPNKISSRSMGRTERIT